MRQHSVLWFSLSEATSIDIQAGDTIRLCRGQRGRTSWRANLLIPEAKKKDFLETQCACGVVLGTKTYVYCRFFLLIPPRDIATPLNNWRSFRRHPRNTRCAKTQWPNLFGPKRLDDKANPFAVEAAPTAPPGSCLYTMHFNRAIEPESISYLPR